MRPRPPGSGGSRTVTRRPRLRWRAGVSIRSWRDVILTVHPVRPDLLRVELLRHLAVKLSLQLLQPPEYMAQIADKTLAYVLIAS